jgi:hypothetical protein
MTAKMTAKTPERFSRPSAARGHRARPNGRRQDWHIAARRDAETAGVLITRFWAIASMQLDRLKNRSLSAIMTSIRPDDWSEW